MKPNVARSGGGYTTYELCGDMKYGGDDVKLQMMRAMYQTVDHDMMPCDVDENFRSPEDYRYSYDPFINYHSGEKGTNGAYTDRIWSWDYKKHDAICQDIWGNRGQMWRERQPAQIQEFVRRYFDKPNAELVASIEYCNASNGYPLWYLSWIDHEDKA